jgi:creatinine amidohydrolase
MKYPGAISLTEDTYERLLTDICASFHPHGFGHIILIVAAVADQKGMKEVAARLNARWKDDKTRVHFIPGYHDYTADFQRQGRYTGRYTGVYTG